MVLVLKPTAAQQSALQQLVTAQQDPASAQYRKWLTPAEYADRFGMSQNDIDQVRAWLESEGFTVQHVSPSRTWLVFSGTAAAAGAAFGTQIRRYQFEGKLHYANATAPSIPAALASVVSSIRGLTDFRLKPRIRPLAPDMLSASGFRAIAPDDFATIYNVSPLFKDGIDGTGQSIAIVGQSRVNPSDASQFRTRFNLAAQTVTPILAPGSTDPGVISGDVDESNLDIEWAGAVARNAQILFYYSTDVWTSAQAAIDDNKAKVLSMSYGACEMMDLVDLPTFRLFVQQANAQGMTFLAASGDSGAGDCDGADAAIAENGPAVDVPASIPEVTGMGGTEFQDQAAISLYWDANNNALQYIPEIVWNNTARYDALTASGGGVSIYFPQPGWQTGPGVPNDGFRHVPDISLASSSGHVPYYVYTSGAAHYYGGTSVAAPSMAGIVALLNQYLVNSKIQSQAGLANINPQLYRMAAAGTAGVFHDVTSGDNKVPCTGGSPGCSSSTPGVNGTIGYSAGANYDMATGLGSVDAYNLIHQWSTQLPAKSSVVPSIDSNPVYQQAAGLSSNPWRFTLTLTEEAGVPTTLTGMTVNGTSYTSQIATLFGTTAIPASNSVSATMGLSNLSVPTNVVFVFSGVDASGTTWTTQMSIPFKGTEVNLGVVGISNAASGQQVFAPGEIVSLYGTGMGNAAQSAGAVPLPTFLSGFAAFVNNVQVPLYYVSPNQVNMQIPYETASGPATLELWNPYQDVFMRRAFTVQQNAPGIFMFADGTINPSPAGSRGQTYVLYITGEGRVSPSVATGDTPAAGTPLASLPKPVQPVSVTVGGVTATTTFVGIPWGLVGATQINFTIPDAAPLGKQPVVVTVGTVSSPPAYFTVQ